MAKRGRPSAAALEIQTGPIEIVERQRAPHDLNDEETEIWAAVVSDYPADWFSPATVPLLAQYCRHTVQARRVAELIEQATSDQELSIVDYDRLLKMQDRETAAVARLATTMRISQQSTTNHRGNRKGGGGGKRPWEG